MLLLALVVLPFAASVVAACLPTNARNAEAWLSGGLALGGLLITGSLYPQVRAGGVVRLQLEWMPRLGADFSLRMDALGWAFAMLVLGIGLLVVLYARYYMSPKDPVARFFSFLLAFMGSMLGLVLSGNLIQLVLFWELTSLTSFLIIGYWHHRADARRGARMSLLITAAGGLCLFVGVLMLGRIVGSYDLDAVLAAGDAIRAHAWYRPALVLIALGAFTKSAQFPFHFWLPHAMAAPTPASAYLHSATMVKAGIFVLMRLWPVLSGRPEWHWLIGGVGVCTMLLGAFVAIFQHDLKGLLAYSTISHLGLITVLLGIGSPLGMVAAVFHTLNHATFKASLFMAAGIIDHETGTRDMRVLRGLYRSMPVTGTLAIVASAAMAGVPLMNGFLSKEMFFAETALVGGTEDWSMSVAAVAMGVFGVAYSLRFISVFFGAPARSPRQAHEPPRWMLFPAAVLVLLCLVVGVAPEASLQPMLTDAARAVLGERTPAFSLAIWHGVNLPLVLSAFALAGGVWFYMVLRRRHALRTRHETPLLHRFSGAQAFETTLLRLFAGAAFVLRWLGSRRTQPQVLLIMGALVVLPMWLARPFEAQAASPSSFDPWFAAMWLVGAGCAVAAAWQAKYNRLHALILVGGTGIVTSMTFLWLSAPDLALTQLMVEAATTLLVLLGLRWLPARRAPPASSGADVRARIRRGRDLMVAVATGAGIAGLAYAVLTRPQQQRIGDFFLLQALPQGGGTNVVNVLLVDFRGFDTLGEITVLAIVALTVYALLRRFRPAPDSMTSPDAGSVDPAAALTPEQQLQGGHLAVPAVYLRLLLPFMLLVAAYFFLRGHNQPGGGFVAALLFSLALIVQYMLAGAAWLESRLSLQPYRWLAGGLLTACLTGLAAWAFGYPFLTSHTAHLRLPLLGELHVPSAFAFDLGVFLVVVGATMLILVALAHQSLRSHRAPAAGAGTLPEA